MIKRLFSNDFIRNVTTLFIGTFLSQIILVFVSPILTRIYNPEEFGIFATLFSLSTIFSGFSNGRLDLAIMLPEEENDAFGVFFCSTILSVLMNLIFLVIVFIFFEHISTIFNLGEYKKYLLLCPFISLFLGLNSSFQYLSNRNKKYKIIAKAKISQSLITVFGQIIFGIILQFLGMLIGYILGLFVSLLLFLVKTLDGIKNSCSNHSLSSLKKLILFYKKFPLIFTFSYGLNTIATNSIPIIISISFGVEYAGYFILVQRVLGMPVSIIVSSIGNVFFSENNCTKRLQKNIFIYINGIICARLAFCYFRKYFCK